MVQSVRHQTTVDSLASNSIASSVYNSAVTVEGARNVIAETVKRGEDDGFAADASGKKDKKHIIIRCACHLSLSCSIPEEKTILIGLDCPCFCRLYEAYGGKASATVKITGLPVASITLANLLEDSLSDSLKLTKTRNLDGVEETTVKVDLKGFEIKTLKVVVGEPRCVPTTAWPFPEFLLNADHSSAAFPQWQGVVRMGQD